MKHKIKTYVTAAIVAGLWVSASGTLKAQVWLEFSISGTVLTQGGVIDNGNVTAAPARSAITTASLLKQLALDEEAAGNWGTNKFPAGTKLYYFTGEGDPFSPGYLIPPGFRVVDKNNQLLVVANVLSLDNIGQSSIFSGYYYIQTNVQLATLTYDATSIGGTNKYTVTGLGTSTIANTAPSQNPRTLGNYTETISFSLQNGTGEGVNADGVNIVLTGVTITESGSGYIISDEGLGGFDILARSP